MPRSLKTSDAFAHAVERALERVSDAEWLGTHSPLATPYVLGDQLAHHPDAESAAGRGRVLYEVLQTAVQQLNPIHQRLMDESFFHRRADLNNLGVAFKLGWSESTYYRHRADAIEALAGIVNRSLLPPLRPEIPRSKTLIGRAGLLQSCIESLRAGHTVALTGAGGIGKTTLGLAIMRQWQQPVGVPHVFWFTVRLGLNDHLSSFVFALGYFLRGLGTANLWRQLVADQGVVNPARVLGLIRHDLDALKMALPLLCVDETDLLKRDSQEHAQLIHLFEELRELVPVLLIGQQLVIEPHQHFNLSGFTNQETAALMAENNLHLSPQEHALLLQTTQGNPALLTLFVTLHEMGEPISVALRQILTAPSMELLFNRIWRRLSDVEREVLMALSVFRSPSPLDVWQDRAAVIEQLTKRGLVQTDELGGIAPLPFVGDFVSQSTPADMRTTLHLYAAQIRETRGDYTAAAHHYVAGRQPAMAVWLWFNHRVQEKERGKASAAYALFRQVNVSELPNEEDRRALSLVRAFLAETLGLGEDMTGALAQAVWPASHPVTPYALQLQGTALEMQGRLQEAVEKYRLGIELITGHPSTREINLHTRLGRLYLYRLKDLDQALQQSQSASFEAERFAGLVAEEQGDFEAAYTHYQTALGLSDKLRHDHLMLRAYVLQDLGILAWKQQMGDEAVSYLSASIESFQVQGDVMRMAQSQINLVAAYIVAGRYDAALNLAREGLQVAESLNNSFLVAGFTSNASEACYYLDRLDEAERYALQCLQYEEPMHQPNAATVLGIIHRNRGKLPQAESSLRMAIQVSQDCQDKFAEAPAWRWLATVFLDQRKISPACEAFNHALQLYKELKLAKEIKATQEIIDTNLGGCKDG